MLASDIQSKLKHGPYNVGFMDLQFKMTWKNRRKVEPTDELNTLEKGTSYDLQNKIQN